MFQQARDFLQQGNAAFGLDNTHGLNFPASFIGRATPAAPKGKHHSDELNKFRQGWTYAALPTEQHNFAIGVSAPTVPFGARIKAEAALDNACKAPPVSEEGPLWLRACALILLATVPDAAADGFSSGTSAPQQSSKGVEEQLQVQLNAISVDFMTTRDAAAVLSTAIICGHAGSLAAVLQWLPTGHLVSEDFVISEEHTTAATWLGIFPSNHSPWHVAAAVNASDAVLACLAASRLPATRLSAAGLLPLQVAAAEGHSRAVTAIAQLPGVRVEASGSTGLPPLLLAVQGAHLECVTALLAAGADPWQAVHGSSQQPPQEEDAPQREMGLGPLALSLSLGMAEPGMFPALLKAALQRPPEWVQLGAPAAAVAAAGSGPGFEQRVQREAMNHALASVFQVNARYNQPRAASLLTVAARVGLPAHVQLLLDTVPVATWKQALHTAGLTPSLLLQLAMANQGPTVLQLLLDAGFRATPDAELLLPAVESGNEELVQLVLDAGSGVNTAHGTCPALAVCLQRGDVRMARLLLGAGAVALSGEAPNARGQYPGAPHSHYKQCFSPLWAWEPGTSLPADSAEVLELMLGGVPPGSVHPLQLPLVNEGFNAVKWSVCELQGSGPGDAPPARWRAILAAVAPPQFHRGGGFDNDEHSKEDTKEQPWWGSIPPSHPMHLSNLRCLCRPLSDLFPFASVPFALLRLGAATLNADAVSWALGPELALFGTVDEPRDLDIMADPNLHGTGPVASLAGDLPSALSAVSCGHGSFHSPQDYHRAARAQRANPSGPVRIYSPKPVSDTSCSGFEIICMPWLFRGDLHAIAQFQAATKWWDELLGYPPPAADSTPEQHAVWNAARYQAARDAAAVAADDIYSGRTPWVPRAELLMATLRCMSVSAADAYAACERMHRAGMLVPSAAPVGGTPLDELEDPFTWDVMFPRFKEQLLMHLTGRSIQGEWGSWALHGSHSWAVGVLQWLSEQACMPVPRPMAAQLQRKHGRRVPLDLAWLRRRRFVLMRCKGGVDKAPGGGQAAASESAAAAEPASAPISTGGGVQWPAVYARQGDSMVFLLNLHSQHSWRVYLYTQDGHRRMSHRRQGDGAVKTHFMALPAAAADSSGGRAPPHLLEDGAAVTPIPGSDLADDLSVLQSRTPGNAAGSAAEPCDFEL